MSFDSVIKSRIISYLTAEKRLIRKRALHERRRIKEKLGHTVHYFHDVSDPYSHLMVQALCVFCSRYNIQLRPHLISGPPEWAVPAVDDLMAYSKLDAIRLACKSGLNYAPMVSHLNADKIEKAQSIIAASLESSDFIETAIRVGDALWNNTEFPNLKEVNPNVNLISGDRLLAKLGHYLGATLYYEGEWYWGIDRLHYLETRLRELGANKMYENSPLIFAPPAVDFTLPSEIDNALDLFFSFRSPYSYLIFDRICELSKKTGITLNCRPLLPMVMRGLSVPTPKRLYILHDAAREARRLKIPFGRICDPLGIAVERGYALIDYARNAGRLNEYISSYLKGVWADGIDAKTDGGLAKIVERAGLDWNAAKEHLTNDRWRDEVEKNRKELTEIGLWGVPCVRYKDIAFWGQDRLWLLNDFLSHQPLRVG